MLHHAYALDAFNYIVENHPPAPRLGGVEYQMELVSNFSPSSMAYQGGARQAGFAHPGRSGGVLEAITVTDYRLRPTPPQEAPCAPFGRPHARIALNPQLGVQPYRVRITLKSSAGPMVLSAVTYGPQGEEQFASPLILQPGGSVTLTINRSASGFVVASPETGCPVDQPLVLDPFSLAVEIVTGFADNRDGSGQVTQG
jgi:hypothetical protein